MQQSFATLIERQEFDGWLWLAVGSVVLAGAKPGQYIAVRCAPPGSVDPLLRRALWIASVDRQAGVARFLIHRDDPAAAYLAQLAPGMQIDLLGPLGNGWTIAATTRSIVAVGMSAHAAALWPLAHDAIGRGHAVTVLLGADDRQPAPPPFLLPPAAEYRVAHGDDSAAAALGLLDDPVLRWADMIATALPIAQLATMTQQVRRVRLQWPAGFAQSVSTLPLACCVGVCGVCAVTTRHGPRLACSDGPVLDLRELVVGV